jgi:hypothetical protein
MLTPRTMKFTASIIFLYCLTTFAAEQTVRVTSLFCGKEEDGQTAFFFEIPVAKTKELPSWSPDKSIAPPLNLSRACEAAKTAIQARYSMTNEVEVRGILLRPLVSYDTWYYDVECQTTKFDRSWSPCGMHAVILMDGSNVEPRVVGPESDMAEAFRQAERVSFDIGQQFARAKMGDTNALIAVFSFSRNVDAAKSVGFGKWLVELLGELGDDAFARNLAIQTPEARTAMASHLEAGVANTKVTRLRRPIAEAFPLTYAALRSSNR